MATLILFIFIFKFGNITFQLTIFLFKLFIFQVNFACFLTFKGQCLLLLTFNFINSFFKVAFKFLCNFRHFSFNFNNHFFFECFVYILINLLCRISMILRPLFLHLSFLIYHECPKFSFFLFDEILFFTFGLVKQLFFLKVVFFFELTNFEFVFLAKYFFHSFYFFVYFFFGLILDLNCFPLQILFVLISCHFVSFKHLLVFLLDLFTHVGHDF